LQPGFKEFVMGGDHFDSAHHFEWGNKFNGFEKIIGYIDDFPP
jgi:hypothetical protein